MILTSGCFDGLHAGHVAFIAGIRQLTRGSHLLATEEVIIAVASDAYIRRDKAREPSWPQADRMEAVLGLKGVSQAIAQPGPTPADLIRTLKPRLFVKGVEWAGALPDDVVTACHEVHALIVYLDTPGRHVSETR